MKPVRFSVAFGFLLLLLSGITLVAQPAIEAAPEGVFMGVVGGKGTEGAKALVYYDVELFPGQEFNGYILFRTEEPNPGAWDAGYAYHWEDSSGWVTMTPLGFRSKGCDEIQRVQFKFTAPNQPGVYKGAVIDNLSNFPAVEIMLIVTEEPSRQLVSSVDTVRARLGDVITQPVGAIWNGLQGSFGCAPVPYFPVDTMLVTLKTFPQDASWLRFNPPTLLSPKMELVVGQRIFSAERMGTFEAYEVRESENFPQPLRRKWVLVVNPPVIRDVNRFGRQVSTVLGGVTVTILQGDNAIGSTVTREDGSFEFEFDPFALDPGLEYSVRLEKDGIRRTFGSLHRDKAFAVRTLPVTVLADLEKQMKRLEESGTLIAGYDLTEVRTLLSDWNNEDPESDE